MQNQKDWSANKQQIPVREKLHDEWCAAHKLQLAAAADAEAVKAPPPVPPNKCFLNGMCLCKGKGLHARVLHDNIVMLLRPRLVTRMSKAEREAAKAAGSKKKQSKARVLMEASRLVLRLWQECDQIQLDAMGWPSLDSDEETGALNEMWLHVNYMNFKDMLFTVPSSEEGAIPASQQTQNCSHCS